ncbi:ABC transporter substrate-binding protein [Pelagibacterium halotolerans]|uniref:Sugar-binding protein n=1 Tax=Pelagibacterium halotolerans (strain DSM 22347 / JCM 15775 / CGMCC 1.7692 / B2) TaxID=1082931 RepID=G4RBM4_PELHB|nr:ABC transporter substrate-binding protein [Pelagibacterium halotolerans]AEQ53665.1 sugar-binding protein [Pelagibacterium halotolerans B2]QJR20166.1 carbohydrate ABC transporter substrate-binding protein [Pelagibacterium halotolerans]SEA90718.1 carbohydrate ABC transporter substrate-binding protein, CUT1 family [Pelagibacterium halotolerans]
MKTSARYLISTALGLPLALGVVASANAQILFWSNQAAPIEETQAMREQVLAGFDGEVDFQTQDTGPFLTRLDAELEAGSGSIGVVGALHGELASYTDNWTDLSDLDLGDVSVSPAFLELAHLGTDELKYLPWMQANYVMAASTQALDYLPEGADIDALTYDQFVDWMEVLATETGSPKFGFPAGPQGLKHRFFQGFLIPSYAGSTVTRFGSDEAAQGWEMFRELWQYTNPASTNYSFMQEPLLAGDVWVAFDHVARLGEAFNQRPDDFVAFPAPSGPVGRGFMPVLAGIAIPAGSPDIEQARALATYMMQPETQVATLLATNFFPTTDAALPTDLPPSAQALGAAITTMTSSEDALPALLPVGLGDLGGQFNQVYVDTFERIILANQDIAQVLEEQSNALRDIIDQAGAPCWEPDEPSEGPCPVD